MPALFAVGHAQRPVEQIAHVGQNLRGLAASAFKAGKTLRCAFKGSGRSVSQGSQRVPQQFAFLIHTGKL